MSEPNAEATALEVADALLAAAEEAFDVAALCVLSARRHRDQVLADLAAGRGCGTGHPLRPCREMPPGDAP